MDFTSYILPELLILVPVLYAIGYALKKNHKIADNNIPLILCGFGIFLSFLYLLSTTPLNNTQQIGMAIFAAITQGILVAAAAVLSNQIIKQSEKADEEEDKDWKQLVQDVAAELITPNETADTATSEELIEPDIQKIEDID